MVKALRLGQRTRQLCRAIAVCLFIFTFLPVPALAISLSDAKTVSKYVAGKVADQVTKEIASPVLAMHNFLAQFGYRTSLEVQYEPMDVPQGIHLKDNPDEPYDNRRIRLEAIVTYDSAKPAEYGKMLAIATLNPMWYSTGQNLATVGQGGMAGAVNEYTAGLPQNGPQEDKPVRWELPMSLLKNVEFWKNDWKGRFLTFTDKDGYSTIYLYPIEDQFLGGVRTKEDFTVRARATCQDISVDDPFQAGLYIGENIIKPANTEGRVEVTIERHVPTRWQGSITVDRTFTYSWNQSAEPPNREKGPSTKDTEAKGNSTWSYSLRVDNIKLDKDGFGEGDYSVQVRGSSGGNKVTKTLCFDDKIATTNTKTNWQGSGSFTGKSPVRIAVRPDESPTYAVLVDTLALSQNINLPAFSGRGTSKVTGKDCLDETVNETNDLPSYPPPSDQQLVIHLLGQSPHPLKVENQWPTFDPDAEKLHGSLTWPTQWPINGGGGSSITGTTTITWNLERVYDKAK